MDREVSSLIITYDGTKAVGFVVKFDTHEDVAAHQAEYSHLKNLMASNMELFHTQRRTSQEHEKYFRRQWVPMSHAFVSRWGKERVPPDLRRGINSAEAGLGLTITTWPDSPSSPLW